MTLRSASTPFDPRLDLVLERDVDVPRELVWKAWTEPEHLMKWFCPLPWKTVRCKIDLRPGGLFHTVMRSPEGQEFPSDGCYLEVVENERLVWTDMLGPGWRPSAKIDMGFTGILALEARGKGTRYVATALHRDEAGRKQHADMGFHEGWGKALDQLVAHAKTMGSSA